MVTGMVFPAYADERYDSVVPLAVSEVDQLLVPSSHENIIYQNGNNPLPNFGNFIDNRIVADDFVLGESTEVTDAHFTWTGDGTGSNIEPLEYFILADNGGLPGAVIDSGTAQNVQNMALGGERFETWFDFVDPVPLDGGVTYWFALTYMPATFTVELPEPSWEFSDVMTGNGALQGQSLPPTNWFSVFQNHDMWFQLTGDDKVVGGKLLSIDSTALILTGAQSFSWMIPLVLSGIGIGLFVVSRKSENS